VCKGFSRAVSRPQTSLLDFWGEARTNREGGLRERGKEGERKKEDEENKGEREAGFPVLKTPFKTSSLLC